VSMPDSVTWSGRMTADRAGLAALADEWADLYARCPGATPFQTHAWVSAYDNAYLPAGALRVLEVRRDGRLVSVAPFVLRRRGPFSVLTAVGGAVTDHHDLLLDPAVSRDEEMWSVLTGTLLGRPDWHVVDLPEVRPGAVAEAWRGRWPGRSLVRPASVCLELAAVSLETALSRLPGRTANTLRRKVRRVTAAGVEERQIAVEGVAEAVERLLGLHARQWAGRGGNPEHLTPRFRALLTYALERLVAEDGAVLTEFRLHGRLAAAVVELVGHDMLSYYLAGVSPELRDEIDTSCLLVPHGLEMARKAGLSRYSLLRGEEDYKYRWRPESVQQQRLLLVRPRSIAGTIYLQVVLLLSGSKRFLKARAPWLRAVRHRLRPR
jgi:CelD/BcsL family acetyltransferase involved in cellulose biosynthesis